MYLQPTEQTIEFDNASNLRFAFNGDDTVEIAVAVDPDAIPWTYGADDLDDLITALELIQAKLRENEDEDEELSEGGG